MKHLMLMVMVALLAVGCACKPRMASHNITDEEILNSKYAYVLAGYAGVPASVWLNADRKFNDSEIEPLEKVTFDSNIIYGVKYHLYRIVPGKYTLVDFYDSGPHKSYSMTEEAKVNNEAIKSKDILIGSFTAEKGRITYIGTMYHTFSAEKQRYNFTTNNRDYEAEAFLAENYPYINPKNVMVFVPAKRGWFIR